MTEHPDEMTPAGTPVELPVSESGEKQPVAASQPASPPAPEPSESASTGTGPGAPEGSAEPEPVRTLQGLEPAWPTAEPAPEPGAPTPTQPPPSTTTPAEPAQTVSTAGVPTGTEPPSSAAPADAAPAEDAAGRAEADEAPSAPTPPPAPAPVAAPAATHAAAPAPTPALIPPHPVHRPTDPEHAGPAAAGVSGPPTAPPASAGAGLVAPKPPPGPPAESFGRVDADGTVWVRTAGGDVHVGQFQAGSPDEALTYFARKYATLETEVSLLEQRLASGADVGIDEAAATIARIDASLETPQVVGDIDGLRVRVAALTPALQARKAAARAEKAKAREAAKAAREAIVVQAEALADSTSWKSSGDRLRTLLDEWKAAPRVDRGTEQAMWKRFSAARNAFDRRRRAHFAKLTSEQGEAKTAKTALVKEAEALSASTDWAATAAEYRRLMDRWKQAGRAARSDDDALWARFRSAQDTFFTARSAAFSERDAGQAENLKAKTALASEAEGLLPLGDLGTAKAALRDIHERWEKVGHVPRSDKERVEGRLRRVEQAVREAEEGRWRRSNPEARARAEASIEQLTTTIAKLDKELARAEAAGDERAATEARESLEARRSWLTEAEKALAEFSGD